MTYTYAVMNVSPACFEEIKKKLIAVQYQHALHNDGKTLDMHGIALEIQPELKPTPHASARNRKKLRTVYPPL
jgi:hypothetical protein